MALGGILTVYYRSDSRKVLYKRLYKRRRRLHLSVATAGWTTAMSAHLGVVAVPAPKFGGGTTEVELAGKIRLYCKRQSRSTRTCLLGFVLYVVPSQSIQASTSRSSHEPLHHRHPSLPHSRLRRRRSQSSYLPSRRQRP